MAVTKPVIFLRLLGSSAQYLLWLDVPTGLVAEYAGEQTETPYEDASAAELAAIVAGEVLQHVVNVPMRFVSGGGGLDGQAMWDEAVEIRTAMQASLNARGSLLVENAYWDGTQVVLPTSAPPEQPPVPPSIVQINVSAITQTGFTVTFEASQPVKAKVQYGASFGSETALTSAFAFTGTLAVTGLTAATTYQARLYIENADGANFTGPAFAVTTATLEVVFTGTGPILGSPTSTSVTITAGSNIAATMKVTLVTVTSPTTILQFGPTVAGTSHSLLLTGLTPNTQYSWTATLTAGSDTETSAPLVFTTANPPVVPPPGEAWNRLLGDLDGVLYDPVDETEPQVAALYTQMKNTFMTRAASTSEGIDIFNPAAIMDVNRARKIMLSGGSGDDGVAHMYQMWQATGDQNFLLGARRVGEVALTDPTWLGTTTGTMYPDYYCAAWSFALLASDDGFPAHLRQLARNVVQNYAYYAARYQTGDIFDCRNASHQVEWMLAARILGMDVINGPTSGTSAGPVTIASAVARKIDFMLDNQAAALTHKNQTLSNNWRGFQEEPLDHSPLQPAPSVADAGGFWLQKSDGTAGGVQTQQTFIGSTTEDSYVVTWTGGANTFAQLPTGVGRGFIHSQDGTTVPYSGSIRILPNWASQVNTTSGSPVVTRGSGNFGSVFDQRMVGRKVTGTNIPTGPSPTVLSVDTGAQTFTMSANATGTTAGVRVTVTVLSKDSATNTMVISSVAEATATGVDFTVGGLHDTHRKGFMDGVAGRALAYYAVEFPADAARVTAALKIMYQSDTPGPRGWYATPEDEGGPLGYSNPATVLSPAYTYLTDGNGFNFDSTGSHYCSENGFHLPALCHLIVHDPDEAEHYYDLAQHLIVGLLSGEQTGRPTGGAAQELRGVGWKAWDQILDGMRFLSALRLGEVEPPVEDLVFDPITQFTTVQGANGWGYLEGNNTPMTWDPTDGRWEGTLAFQNIRLALPSFLLFHPGSTRGSKLRFTVPETGAMRLSLSAHDADTAGGDGVRVIISQSGVGTLQNILIANGQTTPVQYAPAAFAVTAGDTIDLEVTAGSGTNNASDTTAIAYTLTLTPGGSAPPALSASATVAVGTTEVAVHTKAVGFLSGITATGPADALITPLEPKLHRGVQNSATLYNRIVGLGMISQHYMAAGWPAYAVANGLASGTYPGDGGLNWTIWENYVASVVNAETAAGRSHQWDVWNEPNVPQFWPAPRTATQFNELWLRAYDVIKGINAAFIVEGPNASVDSATDRTYLTNFLAFCKANSCVPDVLSWHEIPSAGGSTPWTLKSNVDIIKGYMTAQSITHPPISINEYGGNDFIENKPGVVLTYLAQIEDCGTSVASAAKACWPTSDSTTQSCGQPTLGGYLTLANGKRAGYRIIEAYAALAGTFVAVTADHDILYGSAAVSGSQIVALLGNPRNVSYGDRVVRFTGLSNGAKQVTRERLAQNTGATDWVSLGTISVTVSDTTLAVTVPQVAPFDAFRITVTP